MPVFGFTLPFARSSGSLGYFEVTRSEEQAINASIVSLLVTNWGERVMNYYYGANLIEFLFENQKNNELKSRIADRILQQTSTWLPYLTVDQLNVFFSEDSSDVPEQCIGIRIVYRLNNKPDFSGLLNFVASP